jgi:NADPH-dependent curcumin reductase CurA
MIPNRTREIRLARRPAGEPVAADFELAEMDIPVPGPKEFLVRGTYMSLDPYMRGRMSDAKSYAASTKIGDPMPAGVVGEVVQSNHPRFQVGDTVEGPFGWREHAVTDGTGVRKIDPKLAPISTALGVLGMPGLTAYFGLLDVCEPKAGDTLVVSAASGAVGAVVGQIGRIAGCKVVGIAGGKAKCEYVKNELGFHAAIDYRAPDFVEKLKAACGDGVDCYFDNVGGPVSDAVMPLINFRARVAVCGQIADYNATSVPTGPRYGRFLLVNRARMQGLIVTDWLARFPEGLKRLGAWVKSGQIKYREDVTEGIENAPAAFIGLLKGENFGKKLIKLR